MNGNIGREFILGPTEKVSVSTNPTDCILKGRPHFEGPAANFFHASPENFCCTHAHIHIVHARAVATATSQKCGYVTLVDATRSFANIEDVYYNHVYVRLCHSLYINI